jgi:hypothetical protein
VDWIVIIFTTAACGKITARKKYLHETTINSGQLCYAIVMMICNVQWPLRLDSRRWMRSNDNGICTKSDSDCQAQPLAVARAARTSAVIVSSLGKARELESVKMALGASNSHASREPERRGFADDDRDSQ